jgi:ribonuclease Z
MKLTIIGCNAATPTTTGNPTAQVLEVNNQMVLIDCGEGTQTALRKNKIRFSRINHIFISHLHGDHFYGLIGLISTFSLLKREKDLHIFGPKGLKEIILLQLKLSKSWTNFKLLFHELESKASETILTHEKFLVQSIPLKHRVYTNGFLFKEQPKERKLLIHKALEYNIDKVYFKGIKKGKDVVLEDGTIIPNRELTEDPPKVKSYAFCSDTMYTESIVPIIQGATALYHESTFLEQHSELAKLTKHTTAVEAAHIAKKANVGLLILGHFSTRYPDYNMFKNEAISVFENTEIAKDERVFEF